MLDMKTRNGRATGMKTRSGRVNSESHGKGPTKKAKTVHVAPKPTEEEMLLLNGVARAKKKGECREAIKSLWNRTAVHLEKTDNFVDLIDLLETEAGIVIDSANIACYSVSTSDYDGDDDYSVSLGGFSSEEKKKVYKLPPSGLDRHKLKERRLPRIQTTEPAMTVIFDGEGHICLIHLQNVLTDHQLEERTSIKNIFFGKMIEGWCKVCGLSGFINLGDIIKTLRDNAAAQKAYFGGFFREYMIHTVLPTYNGKGGTAKTLYENRNGEQRKFQVGNHINRAIIPGSDKSLKDNT